VLARPRPRLRRRAAALAPALALTGLALASCAGAAPTHSTTATGPPPAAHSATAPCGAATQATVAAVDADVTEHIYLNELAGGEVNFDIANIISARDLRKAVAADDKVATFAAARRIVFHPAWHIVRLQVFDAAGKLLADFGGTYAIAPVGGILQSGARTIGRFLMTVQDDVGVTKLETRFVGNPIAIYLASGFLVADRYATFPPTSPPGPTLTVGTKRYLVVRQTVEAFPSGSLLEVTLVPPPPPSLTPLDCTLVRAQEFGRIAMRLAALATDLPHEYRGYATTVAIYTGINVFVRRGSRLLGTSGGSGPASPPASGTVTYMDRTWLVFSFKAAPPARVYLLIPPA
jgi:hypothetical protein